MSCINSCQFLEADDLICSSIMEVIILTPTTIFIHLTAGMKNSKTNKNIFRWSILDFAGYSNLPFSHIYDHSDFTVTRRFIRFAQQWLSEISFSFTLSIWLFIQCAENDNPPPRPFTVWEDPVNLMLPLNELIFISYYRCHILIGFFSLLIDLDPNFSQGGLQL